jgi:predicted Zn-dependent protease
VKEQFFELSDRLARELHAGEVLLCNFSAERSDFVRLSKGRVRQAGSVEQRSLTVRLALGCRHAAASLALAGGSDDLELARAALARLREVLADLPEDPWFSIAEHVQSTSSQRRGALAPAEAVVDQVVTAAQGRDLAGLYAAGTIYRGFANSLGQRNWHEIDSFNFDWSLHNEARQAVKSRYAGSQWDSAVLTERIESAAQELALLAAPARAIEPAQYRTYLAPLALEELTGLLSWGGFSARAHATRQSPLLRMAPGAIETKQLSSKVTLIENTSDGIAPGFQSDGFVKPASVTLIAEGRLADALVSPRSAKEYGLSTNAANSRESPESIELAPGLLESSDVLAALDTGLYVSNLWYLNFSDRAAGRITGMTRFATFWVERGRISAPVGAMRFDDTIYRMLGKNLEELTRSREFLADPSTYEERSTASALLPGALLSALRFTL